MESTITQKIIGTPDAISSLIFIQQCLFEMRWIREGVVNDYLINISNSSYYNHNYYHYFLFLIFVHYEQSRTK